MAHDVFISYASEDKTTADAICATLERLEIRCWMAPRDILPGSDWAESLIEAIRSSRVMVLVFSSHANASPQVKKEIERAVNNGTSVLPLRIEDVLPSKSLEYFLSTPHWLDAMTPPLERHLNQLAEVIRLLLDPSRVSDVSAKPMPTPPAVSPKTKRVIWAAAGIVILAGLAFAGYYATIDAPPATTVEKTDSDPLAETLKKSRQAVEAGNSQEAVDLLSQAIEQAASAQLFVERAKARYHTGDEAGTRGDCTHALKLDSRHAEAYAWRAIAETDSQRAIDDADQALQMKPGPEIAVVAQAAKSRGFAIKSDLPTALSGAKKARDDYPQSPWGYIAYANALVGNGRASEAIEYCDKAVSLAPKLWVGYQNRAMTCLMIYELQRSLEDATTAINLAPFSASCYATRGMAYALDKNPQASLDDTSKAIELEPKGWYPRFVRSHAYMMNNEPRLALVDAKDAVKLNDQSDLAYSVRGFAHFMSALSGTSPADNRSHLDSAIEDFGRAAELNDLNPEHYQYRAITRMARKHADDLLMAVTELQIAKQIARTDAIKRNIQLVLGEALVESRDYRSASHELDETIKASEPNGVAFFWRGRAKYGLGEYQQAVEDFTAAIDNFKNNVDIPKLSSLSYYYRVLARIQNNDLLGALKDLQEADQQGALMAFYLNAENRSPNFAAELSLLSRTYAAQQRFDDAVQMLEKALSQTPESSDVAPELYYERGRVQFWKGSLTEALTDLSKAIELNPKASKFFRLRGTIYSRLAQETDAEQDRKKAAELDPQSVTKWSVTISHVPPMSPGGVLGLQKGDVIVSYNDIPIEHSDQFIDLIYAAGSEERSLVLQHKGLKLIFQVLPGPLGITVGNQPLTGNKPAAASSTEASPQ